jgi:hypothetical protein
MLGKQSITFDGVIKKKSFWQGGINANTQFIAGTFFTGTVREILAICVLTFGWYHDLSGPQSIQNHN